MQANKPNSTSTIVESSCYLPWANNACVITKLIIFSFPKQLSEMKSEYKITSIEHAPIQAVLVPRALRSIVILLLSKKIEGALAGSLNKK